MDTQTPTSPPNWAGPEPTPGLDEWLRPDGPGAIRLPWLPATSPNPLTQLVLPAICVVGGLALLVGSNGWQRVAALVAFAIGGALYRLDRRRQAGLNTASFLLISADRASLRVVHAASELDVAIPVAALRAIGIVTEGSAGRLVLHRQDAAPSVMASGLMPIAHAEMAARSLAARLGVATATDAPAPHPPEAAAAEPPAKPSYWTENGQRIEIRPPAGSAARMAFWLGAFFVALGLAMLLVQGAPLYFKLIVGVAPIVAGVVIIARRDAWERSQQRRVAIIDLASGWITVTIPELGPTFTAQLSGVRRLVLSNDEEYSSLTLDFFDRPGITLLAGVPREEQALAARLGALLGCPVERR